ncbi:MAG: hypothetical protein BGN88_01545 [Clostridiales bacterium 43-6]|nr:MAG: hypothetical protein BGN88_01545 [Clostridiales bacterium 43-6]
MIISGAIKLSKRKLDPKNTSFEDEKARKLFLRTNDDPELFKREVMVDMVSKTVCFSFTTKDIFKENSVPYKTKKSISISQITKISTKSRPGGGEKITFRTTVNGYGFFSLIYDSPKATEIANKIKSYIINDSE